MRTKRFVFSLIILIASLHSLFATGTNEFRLFEIPRSVANNSFKMIDLLGNGTVTTSKLTGDYSLDDDNNLAIFRLSNTLYKNKLQSGASGENKASVTVTSEDSAGFFFVHEENPTVKFPFELEVYLVKGTLSDGEGNYSYADAVKVTNGITSASNSFSVVMDSTDKASSGSGNFWDQAWSWVKGNVYATNINNYDFCIKLNPASGVTYEPGYYTTTFVLNSTQYEEAVKKNNGAGNTDIAFDKIEQMSNVSFTVRAYLGVDPESTGDGMNYSFSINPAADTYEMDLEDSSRKYEVASLFFYKINANLTSNPNATSWPQTPKQFKKYTLYISPTNIYNAQGTYQFIKYGSEKQERTYGNTVDYKLYVKDASGNYVDLTGVVNTTYTNLNTSTGTTKLTNITAGSNQTVYNTAAFREGASVFVLLPSYIVESTGKNSGQRWKEEWSLDCKLYLTPVNSTTPDADGAIPKHQKGLYYSYLYFTVVTN